MESEEVKKRFPKLFGELEAGGSAIPVDGVRWAENIQSGMRDPDVISFLRRCDSDEQGLEIISYLERRGELTKEMAEDLRQQIKSRGIRSFGSKKRWGYYEHTY